MAFEGLGPGDSRTFPDLSGAWLRIGDPHDVAVAINGAGIPLPPVTVPYNVTVEEGAPSSA